MKISDKNIKMGAIPSFSLPSGVTCSKEACQTCYLHGCYAHKIEKMRPNVLKAYQENYQSCLDDLKSVEAWLMSYFQAPNAPRLFRIHVHGDFYSVDYFSMWIRIAKANPTTTFLAFTKQYDIIKNQLNNLPDNFSLVWSAWPDVPIPEDVRDALPIAWMQDGTETRIPANATLCVGSCQVCHAKCWTLKHQNVVFEKH